MRRRDVAAPALDARICHDRAAQQCATEEGHLFLKVSNGTVELEDRRNFSAFKLVVEGRPEDVEQVGRALSGTAEVSDQNTAWVFEDALRRWPGVADDAGWQQGLTGMIEKAKPYGWIDEERKAIKAHIEWV
jgi:hypothetical protein